jgi:uracil-DNA glycosylase
MRVDDVIKCKNFPCDDVRHNSYTVPYIDLTPEKILAVMVSEASPEKLTDYYYASENALFQKTTMMAFNDAGAEVSSIQDILDLGVYLTTAVKCGKIGYGIKSRTIESCSNLLEYELALFPNIKVILLMGDVAIKSINYIAKRRGEKRPIPAGSTYKIRGQEYYYRGKRLFPSYLQAGPAFFIEKSKRKMIAEDISQALGLIS